MNRLSRPSMRPATTIRTGLIFPSGLLHFIEVGLKLGHLVGKKTKRVVQGEVFDIRLIVLGFMAKLVEFGKERFGFHSVFPSAASAPKSDNALERCRGLVARYREPWGDLINYVRRAADHRPQVGPMEGLSRQLGQLVDWGRGRGVFHQADEGPGVEGLAKVGVEPVLQQRLPTSLG